MSLRAGVVGVGYLGRFHAQKYEALEGVELAMVADIHRAAADEQAQCLGARACYAPEDMLGQVDAVSIVVPTVDHYRVARMFLAAGVHVMLEKPITRTIEEADELIALAREKNLVLQVGHLERFNPAMLAARPYLGRPLFIEASRLSPFNPRGTDVDVVLDLMIHDLDLVLSLTEGAFPVQVSAAGVNVLTNRVDIASARLEFADGLVANLTASRVSGAPLRKFRVFQKDRYLSLDLGGRKASVADRRVIAGQDLARIETSELAVEPADAIMSELGAFIGSIRTGQPPVVSGEDGRRALQLAHLVIERIQARLAQAASLV